MEEGEDQSGGGRGSIRRRERISQEGEDQSGGGRGSVEEGEEERDDQS